MRFHLIALALTLLIGTLNTVNALTKPLPRPLSLLGIKNGSVVALRNNWPAAIQGGQGYLSLCNRCPKPTSQSATHTGGSKDNTWSQFKIEFVKKSKNGYQLVRLKSIWGNSYLAVNKKRRDSRVVATFERTASNSRAKWWAMVVKKDGKQYLALMSDYHKGHTVKLCETCWQSEGRRYLTISEDAEDNWESYHLYTVEPITPKPKPKPKSK
ncbi:MAG: hypothetical protein J3Q66DRAFT_400869 [Benniella sp.]|nr:MAG: hypothetical protein J3Q66DRAFT_400869 [Benniella sp.]